ncbi:type II and III secretion system protein [Akkermansiaceae bacterium]|nr:type II and III secretion system protein [bacterium]MDB2429785.1 type II and III secretion system protein [Akkermansiaceae bacterium]MDB4730858.1 type II and III secretion system protein [Akkermansiaceae bacterium]MDB4758741.1 type II and III secretion system protein [Akkermansiaceae bacterium]
MQKRHTPLTNRTMFALAALVVSPMAHGQDLVGQELVRRQEAVRSADALLLEGRKAYAEADYETAVQKYKAALDTLPFGSATSDRRAVVKQHLQDGSVALSQQYRLTGKYDEARNLLEDVDAADPGNAAAEKGLEYLDDPIRTNPSLSDEHSQNIDKVRRYLYKGNGYYDLGLYDKAEEEFKNAIRIDPYNKAARRWLEKCSAIKSDYYRAAFDQTRARMLMEVDKAWELAVPPVNDDNNAIIDGPGEVSRSVSIAAKLQQIVIPVVDFNNTTVEEAIDFLRIRSIELDLGTLDEKEKGVNFVVRKPKVVDAADDSLDAEGGLLGDAVDPSAVTIDKLYLTNVPLQVALQYICDKAKLRYKVDEYAVTLLPLTSDETDDIVTRRWSVPPTFENFLDSGGGSDGATGDADPFATEDPGGGKGIKPRKPIQELLREQGVVFIDGTSASLLTGSGTLVVRNTPTQLELIDAIVEAAGKETPRQIRVLTKFVEVTQENSDELGFDWIATPFGVGSNYFLGGGTVGSGAARTNADFINPVARTSIPGIPASQNQEVSGIATAGLRSGATAVNRNSIDAILNNPQRTAQSTRVAPGILSMTGLFNSGQVQMIMRGLAQKKGADIMTAPSVVARPGQNATIEIIREFIYPTEYEPPELPNQVGATGNNGGVGLGGGGGGGFPVTPATPTSFDTKKTGVTLEVEPQVGANDNVIDLRFSPTIVEFEGFVNYGSPITSPASDALGNPVQIVITENRIEMPVFSVRRVTTGLTIYDGYTVAVGGLMREDVQSVEDKVPILGDLPFVGRLFQSKADNHIKSNLIIFVTAEIIDATGRRISTAASSSVGGAPVGATMLPPVGGPGN